MNWAEDSCEVIHSHPHWAHVQSATLQQDAWGLDDKLSVDEIIAKREIEPAVALHMAENRARRLIHERFGPNRPNDRLLYEILSDFMALWVDGFIAGVSTQKTLEHGL